MVEFGTLAADRGVGRLGRSTLGVLVRGRGRASRASGLSACIAACEVHHGRQPLGIHVDQLGGVLGGRLGLGDDERHRLPDEQRLLAGERLEHPHVLDRGDRQIGGGQDRDHTGHRRAAAASIPRIRAWAYRLGTIRAWSSPTIGMSAAYRIVPRTFSFESVRGRATPTLPVALSGASVILASSLARGRGRPA